MKLTHPSGRPLTAEEEKMVVDAMPWITPKPLTPDQIERLTQVVIRRLFGKSEAERERLEALLVVLEKTTQEINAIERRIRAAEWIEVKEKEASNVSRPND